MTTTRSDANDLFIALAHPLRRLILREVLAEGSETSPRELASALGQPLSRLSYHVRVLSACGALELVRTKQIRGSTQHFYRSTLEAPWAKLALAAHDGSPGDDKG
jgi:DNA-binding transcriptional ArsR family regulator